MQRKKIVFCAQENYRLFTPVKLIDFYVCWYDFLANHTCEVTQPTNCNVNEKFTEILLSASLVRLKNLVNLVTIPYGYTETDKNHNNKFKELKEKLKTWISTKLNVI